MVVANATCPECKRAIPVRPIGTQYQFIHHTKFVIGTRKCKRSKTMVDRIAQIHDRD